MSEMKSLEALEVVVQHSQNDQLELLKRENRLLKAVQLETAASADGDIFAYFTKINDPEQPEFTENTLLELRDFIMEHSVAINTGSVADSHCVFSTLPGYHPFCSAVVKACDQYEKAVQSKGGADKVVSADWQWSSEKEPAMLCHQSCLYTKHMHVEDTSIRVTRYPKIIEYPVDWVTAALKAGHGNDATRPFHVPTHMRGMYGHQW
jgi:hypothetical protein